VFLPSNKPSLKVSCGVIAPAERIYASIFRQMLF
jgi:hypothetical protein